jgi:SAM-dependent methyltransferase
MPREFPDLPAAADKLAGLLQCPKCRQPLHGAACWNTACPYSSGFLTVRGQPVLIDFDNSIFDRSEYEHGKGFSEPAPQRLGRKLETALMGKNRAAEANIARVLDLVRATQNRRILVIGGGTVGSGIDALYQANDVTVIGTDVYASTMTDIIADGHSLPFRDGVFDAVVIQAVLEHVLDPSVVVAEIHRVLRPGGVVYAETPFMQQVHMGAYDFTRFTKSGHRWLFRRFEEIEAGAVSGAGMASIWSLRYLLRAAHVPRKLENLLTLCAFPLRFIGSNDRDAASGYYFLGRLAEKPIGPKDMVGYYTRSNRLMEERLADAISYQSVP